ncbi:Acetyl-hydrolase [Fusarium oxysporum f. sp. albedinis]|nr:Acetyl-hydrolase [Fusarium oxysporum f. sp. albedinis]
MAVCIMFTTEIGVNHIRRDKRQHYVTEGVVAHLQRRLTMDSQKIRTRDHDSSLEAGSLRPDDSRHFIVSCYMFN